MEMGLLESKFIYLQKWVCFKAMGSERVLLFTNDDITMQQMLATMAMFSENVKSYLSPWRRELYALKKN